MKVNVIKDESVSKSGINNSIFGFAGKNESDEEDEN